MSTDIVTTINGDIQLGVSLEEATFSHVQAEVPVDDNVEPVGVETDIVSIAFGSLPILIVAGGYAMGGLVYSIHKRSVRARMQHTRQFAEEPVSNADTPSDSAATAGEAIEAPAGRMPGPLEIDKIMRTRVIRHKRQPHLPGFPKQPHFSTD